MTKLTFASESPDMTSRLGRVVGSLCEPGDVICLSGPLGAGKTTLTQAIAAGAGIDPKEYVSSPSYAIMHEYRGQVPIYHMDFYRLDSSADAVGLGLDDYLYGRGIAVIEWGERAAQVIPADHLLISLERIDGTSREIIIASRSPSWQRRMGKLQHILAGERPGSTGPKLRR